MTVKNIVSKNRELMICWIVLSVFLTFVFVNRFGIAFSAVVIAEEFVAVDPDNALDIEAARIFSFRMSQKPPFDFELAPGSPDFEFFANNLEYFLEKSADFGDTFSLKLPSSRFPHLDELEFTVHPQSRKLIKVIGRMSFL